jgi:small conductance mechanosensitive channel
MKSEFQESYDKVVTKMEDWLDLFVTNIPNLLVAITVFAASYFLAGLVRKYLQKILKRTISQATMRNLVSTLVSILVIGAGLFIALSVLHLNTLLKSLLAGAGVAGLAVGLALQSSLSNTFSGIYLSIRDILNVGDWVETNGFQGTVHEVNLRNTVIREPDNNMVIIPNKLVLDNPFKNYGLTQQIRVILKCGISYSEDLEAVEEIAKRAIQNHFPQDASREIEFHYLEFGDSSINFQLRFWVDAQAKLTILESRSRAIKVIKKAFDEHGIDIPFPIRTVYLNQDE